MLLVHILALSLVCSLCYGQNKLLFCADAVCSHYVFFPFPLYEKAYSCLAVVGPRMEQ